MEKDRVYEDLSLIQRRATVVAASIGIILLLIGLVCWKIQILDHGKYWALSEANRFRESVIAAPRGLIKDRNEVILADYTPSFRASIIRENCRDLDVSIENIARLLAIAPAELRLRIEKYASLPAFQPIVVKDNLDLREVSRIESRRLEFPELIVENDPRRFYPFGSLAAHVIGYLQEVNPEELKGGTFKGKMLGDLVGRTGVEREYETQLTGVNGRLTEIVDSQGRPRGQAARVEPAAGGDLGLTLDFDIQKKASELLEGREGAIIVMDPRNGDVLALASYPTYDPNKFITRFTPQEWMDLMSRPDHPLENRVIRGQYSPGSIFKLTMAAGGLKFGAIAESTTFYCPGFGQFYGRPFACWKAGGHGALNLTGAIQNSCNVYFYNVGRRLGVDRIAEAAESLGLGEEKTGIDLPGEKGGIIPSEAWSQSERKSPWYPGETISVAIGQGPVLVTPVQVAVHTAILANRGKRVVPRLLQAGGLREGPAGAAAGEDSRPGAIPAGIYETVVNGMWRCVNEGGTGKGADVDGFDVCGKTGSTQIIGRETAERLGRKIMPHSWFTGFAPRDNPRVVVTVLVEFGGMGGATAAPLAREIFALYKEKYD
ncbi:MAG: penicillin-binding protein 2 [Candidatus Aminicenantes bacterium RBG_16_63_16]|nr:MAG: penicillin-binding protein 2 [Candidatus Aminicenantes bacterium RBG_16_63_16]